MQRMCLSLRLIVRSPDSSEQSDREESTNSESWHPSHRAQQKEQALATLCCCGALGPQDIYGHASHQQPPSQRATCGAATWPSCPWQNYLLADARTGCPMDAAILQP
mmetsp:Transcript_103853/g.143650  ORF Transcript_103853/g.143650 Transcript_103853/m.143650 type:complete len:107 (+) Transcript_103853:92-412(+)